MSSKQLSTKFLTIDQVDLVHGSLGGINTFINSLISYSPDFSYSVIGISENPRSEIGLWKNLKIGEKRVQFLAVAKASNFLTMRIPNSLVLALGILRFRKMIPNGMPAGTVHTHRLEIAFFVRMFLNSSPILFLHNSRFQLSGKNSSSKWRYFPTILKYVESYVLQRSRAIICLSRSEYDRLRHLELNIFHFQTWFESGIFSREIQHDRKDMKLIWVGRLENEKNPYALLGIVKELRAQGVNFHLTIIGDGLLAPTIRLQANQMIIADSITFKGNLPKSEVALHLRQSDALLMTSIYEGSSIILKEALASGIPVIANRDSDPDGNIINGKNGFILNRLEPKEFVDSIAMIGDIDREFCVESVSYFSDHVILPRLLDLLNSLK